MSKRKSPKESILAARLKGESRLGQAKRTGVPESTLRWIEANDRWPADPDKAAAHRRRLGLEVA